MQCSICYDNITTETGMTQLSCEHTFHFRCIAQWMIEHSTCPCCRNKVSEYENLSDIHDEDTTILQEPPQISRLEFDELIDNLIEAANVIAFVAQEEEDEEDHQTVPTNYSYSSL